MNKALLLFLVPGIMAFPPVTLETEEDGDAEVDHALQPFWDLLLAKVTVFSENWSQRIKEVMRSLSYPNGHYKCPDQTVAAKKVNATKAEDRSPAIEDVIKQDVIKKDDVKKDDVKQDIIKKDDVKKDDVKKDDVKQDDVKQDDKKKDDFLEQPASSAEKQEKAQE